MKESDHLENPDIGGRIILTYIVKTLDERVLTEHLLAQNRERWRPFANTVMKMRVPQNDVSLLTGRGITSFSRRAFLLEVTK